MKSPRTTKRESTAAVSLAPSPAETISGYATYEDYLDAQITPIDLYYLEDTDLARQLIEHGYRGNAEILSREEFKNIKDVAELARIQALRKTPKKIFSEGKDLEDSFFLKELAKREVPCRDGKLATIIFVRDVHPKGHEVSGYIDYGERLKTEDLEPLFLRKKRLLPKPYDLSYYNWKTKVALSASSSNFQVIAESDLGLLFKNKIDRKVINVNANSPPGDLTTRTEIATDEYKHVILYDHETRDM